MFASMTLLFTTYLLQKLPVSLVLWGSGKNCGPLPSDVNLHSYGHADFASLHCETLRRRKQRMLPQQCYNCSVFHFCVVIINGHCIAALVIGFFEYCTAIIGTDFGKAFSC